MEGDECVCVQQRQLLHLLTIAHQSLCGNRVRASGILLDSKCACLPFSLSCSARMNLLICECEDAKAFFSAEADLASAEVGGGNPGRLGMSSGQGMSGVEEDVDDCTVM